MTVETERKPKAGEHALVYGDRLLIRRLTTKTRGPMIQVEDDAGWDTYWPVADCSWDDETRTWLVRGAGGS